MTGRSSIEGPDAAAAKPGNGGAVPFGLVAYLGAALSIVTCYASVVLALMAPLLGLSLEHRDDAPLPFGVNPHVQAVVMWVFALLAVVGLARDRRKLRRNGPLVAGLLGLAVIVGTLYVFYDVRVLILGYVLLVVAAFLNQNKMLGELNRTVRAQSRELASMNSTLERRVEEQVEEIERLARLKRFLAPEVADLITSRGEDPLLRSHRRHIATVFCDIRGFTAFSEGTEPEESIGVLQTYHEHLGRLVAKHRATIDHRAGDGLMVFFNDPIPCDEPVLNAAKLAAEMRTTFGELNEQWRKRGYRLGFGVGMSSGYATLGLVGFEGRYDYTANGNAVNLASRLCDEAADGEILITHKAFIEVEQAIEVGPPRELRLKGFTKPILVYNIVALKDAAGGSRHDPQHPPQ